MTIEVTFVSAHDIFHYAAAKECADRGHGLQWALVCDRCRMRMPPCRTCYNDNLKQRSIDKITLLGGC